MAITINHQTNDISASSGSMTIDGASAGGGTADFVASGAIANGDTVILNSDGTVSVAGNYGNGSVASRTDVSSAGALYQKGTYDINANKLLVVYQDRDNSNYGTAVVGTVSGTSITFGTPVVYNSASTQRMRVIYCSASYVQKSVIVYENFGDSSTDAKVATISGTTVTFGAKFDVKPGVYTDYGDLAYDPDNNRVLFAYWDGAFANSGYGRARLLYVSGTNLGGGTTVTFNAADSKEVSTTYDTNENKFVITYRDGGNSGYGTSVVGTVSNTSISFGTPVVFLSGNMVGVGELGGGLTFDSTNNKIITAYGDSATNSGRPTIQVGTVSGTSITWGTKAQFAAVNYATPIGVVYDAASNKIIANYRNGSVTDQMRGLVGTVSGTTVTFEPEIGLSDGAAYHVNTVPVSGGIVAAIVNKGQTTPTNAAVVQMAASNITDTNFLGLAAGAISDTATGAITITGGTNTAQSGLTVGEDYFIADDGTLTTTNNGRKVGRATATTKILVNPAFGGGYGSWSLISTTTVTTSTSSVDFTSLSGETYYKLVATGVKGVSGGNLLVRVSRNSTVRTIDYQSTYQEFSPPVTTITTSAGPGTSWEVGYSPSASTGGNQTECFIYDTDANRSTIYARSVSHDGNANKKARQFYGADFSDTSNPLDGLSILSSAGNIAEGTFSLYSLVTS